MLASINEVREALKSFLDLDQLNFYSIDTIAPEEEVINDLVLLNVIGETAQIPLSDAQDLLEYLRERTVDNVIFIATAGAPAVRPRVGMRHEPEIFESMQELLEKASIIMDYHNQVFSVGTPFVLTLPSDTEMLEEANLLHIRLSMVDELIGNMDDDEKANLLNQIKQLNIQLQFKFH